MFKSLQVLRTTQVTTTHTAVSLPIGTRVVVINVGDNDVLTCRVQDPAQPTLARARVTLNPSDVSTTRRGRPGVKA